MGLIDWVLVCGTGLIIKSGISKEKERKRIAEQDYKNFERELKKDMTEIRRLEKVNEIREETFVYFSEGISRDEFISLAKETASEIKRITDVEIHRAKVYCTVSSQSGITDWNFSVDFNNWGHITGTYWTYRENYDSNIPEKYGKILSSKICELLEEKSINVKDFSDEVDNNKHLCSGKMSYHKKEKLVNKKIIKKYKSFSIGYNSNELIGEHIYPVVSIFRNRGFTNITVLEAKEATNDSYKDIYEVFKIKVNGSQDFKNDTLYPENVEIKICYYGKKVIQTLKSSQNYKGCNIELVKEELFNLGFTNIYESEIKNILLGIITKEGSVEKVTVGKSNKILEKNKKYSYDDKIVIYYHTKK